MINDFVPLVILQFILFVYFFVTFDFEYILWQVKSRHDKCVSIVFMDVFLMTSTLTLCLIIKLGYLSFIVLFILMSVVEYCHVGE